MSSAGVLESLAAMLASGGIEVVDCSGTLGPDTPIPSCRPTSRSIPRRSRSTASANTTRRVPSGLELAEAGRAQRHAFRCAAPLDHRQGLSGRLHRHPRRQSAGRSRQRPRLLGGVPGEPGLPAHRRSRQGVGSKARRDQGRRMGGAALRLGPPRP